MLAQMDSCIRGSRALCAAILKTGKLHRKMSVDEQIEAVKYAHNVGVIIERKKK